MIITQDQQELLSKFRSERIRDVGALVVQNIRGAVIGGQETTIEETTTVTMSGPEGATIHYTTDGSTPTSASTVYSEALTLNDTTTVKAIAVKDDASSSVTSRTS